MPLNLGYIEGTANDGDLVVRVYYDATFSPVGADQPLIDGPRGYCLDMTNLSGARYTLSVTSATGTLTLQVAQGNPVTTGPTSGRSRTAAQMAALGFTTRGSIGNFSIG
jgi:hypothetical protein